MGRENGTYSWIQYDDERAFLERGELATVIREVIGGRLAWKHFSLETLQQILCDEHDIPIQLPALRGHVNVLIEAGEVTISQNGGGNGGPRVYHSESIRRDPTSTKGDLTEILSTSEEAEFVFNLCRGRSSHTIRARSCWDSDW